MAYRIYITDSLYYQSQGKRLSVRYAELIAPKTVVDTRDQAEIVSDIMNKAGLRFKT